MGDAAGRWEKAYGDDAEIARELPGEQKQQRRGNADETVRRSRCVVHDTLLFSD
jgi:hypothetical protein